MVDIFISHEPTIIATFLCNRSKTTKGYHMKKLLIGFLALTSITSAFAERERITTRCGKPELVIQGVTSIKVVEHVRRQDKNTLNYEIRINGEKIIAASGFELDSLVARTAIEEGAELCETVKRVGDDLRVSERSLSIKR
jgi:hypothetical protein